jgi:hypothetical protein
VIDGPQFTSAPFSGTTPTQIRVAAGNFNQHTPDVYSGTMTVTVTDPLEVSGSPHVIDLSLRVVDSSFVSLYLPTLKN